MSHVKGHVLVVDDNELVRRAVERVLTSAGHRVDTAANGIAAIDKVKSQTFDVILSDIAMPGMTGIELLRSVRAHDLDIPVLIMTGDPDVTTAIRAMEFGALRYIIKPTPASELLAAIDYAVPMCRMARVKREAIRLLGDAEKFVGDRAGLEAHFPLALDALWMAYQPIISWSGKSVFAYEALLRSSEPTLNNPSALLTAAEQLGRLNHLGRAVRGSVASIAATTTACKLFVNLHTLDLNDDELFDLASPLTKFASNIVLEITERASLDALGDVHRRLRQLRELGYQIALDDLGAGYAGLTSLAIIGPEVVKIDMSLVRDIDKNETKQKLVGTMVHLSTDMGMLVVVEGVETIGERDTLIGLGCDLFQGYLFAKPGKPFPVVSW